MLSITDWAFSWPISMLRIFVFVSVFTLSSYLSVKPKKSLPWRERDSEVIRTLIVIEYISLVVATAVVGFPNAHGVVRKVDIAVIA